MERRRPRKTKIADTTTSFAMILVDGTRIRQKIKREYEKVLRDLEKARAEVERFEKEDSPAYTRWIHRLFGTLLTELRETTRRIHELEQLFLEVETEMLFSEVSPGQAYARVLHRRENPEPSPETDSDEEDPFSGAQGNKRGQPHHGWEQAEAGFDDFFDFSGKKKPGLSGRNSATGLGRLKELYRALARRLHPDAQKEMTPQKQEWWHQAQAAYETGDVEQLEIILSLCEIEHSGTTEKTSLSLLQRISAQLKKSLRQIKSQLAAHRQEPAWNFNRRTDMVELEATMRRQLNHDLHLLKEELDSMELQVAALNSQSKRRRAPRRRGWAPDPFEFF